MATSETFNEIADTLGEWNEEALLADGYEKALVGICERFGQSPLALYDYEKCIDILMTRDGMAYTEAVEFFEFNTIGAWAGDGTPCFAKIWKEVDEDIPRGKEVQPNDG